METKQDKNIRDEASQDTYTQYSLLKKTIATFFSKVAKLTRSTILQGGEEHKLLQLMSALTGLTFILITSEVIHFVAMATMGPQSFSLRKCYIPWFSPSLRSVP